MRYKAVRRLSHSSLLTLHRCPRLFLLSRLKPAPLHNIHLAFGHAVGAGIQSLLCGDSFQTACWKAFLAWDPEISLLEEKEKDKKSFWFALGLLDKFQEVRDNTFFASGWEVARISGVPAIELGARIQFFDGFEYLLFIDAVLVNRRTGELKVLEIKTTKYDDPSPALYANSLQATLYSVFLDAIVDRIDDHQSFSSYSSYEVIYLVASSTQRTFYLMPFKKHRLSKAKAVKNIVLDIERLQEYEAQDYFPMYGESCFEYASYRPCAFFGICNMELENIMLKSKEELAEYVPDRESGDKQIQFEITALDIINAQLG